MPGMAAPSRAPACGIGEIRIKRLRFLDSVSEKQGQAGMATAAGTGGPPTAKRLATGAAHICSACVPFKGRGGNGGKARAAARPEGFRSFAIPL
jgi:hypothetical protein